MGLVVTGPFHCKFPAALWKSQLPQERTSDVIGWKVSGLGYFRFIRVQFRFG